MDSKIQTYARRCEFVAYGALVLAIGGWLVKWTVPINKLQWFEPIIRTLDLHCGNSWFNSVDITKLPLILRFAGLLVDGITVAIFTYGFWFFITLMRQFKTNNVFSTEMVTLLNKIAKIIFWFALYIPISRTLVALIISLNNPPGQRWLIISLESSDLFTLAASWFFVLLTSLMRESLQLQAEHDATV